MQMTTAVRLERILVAVDFSPPSKHALRYAVHFAKLFEAKLSFLHVAERIGFGIGAETPGRLMTPTGKSKARTRIFRR